MLNPELKPCSIEEDNLRSGFGEEQTAVLSPSPDSTCSGQGSDHKKEEKGKKERKKRNNEKKREKRKKKMRNGI